MISNRFIIFGLCWFSFNLWTYGQIVKFFYFWVNNSRPLASLCFSCPSRVIPLCLGLVDLLVQLSPCCFASIPLEGQSCRVFNPHYRQPCIFFSSWNIWFSFPQQETLSIFSLCETAKKQISDLIKLFITKLVAILHSIPPTNLDWEKYTSSKPNPIFTHLSSTDLLREIRIQQ